MASLEADERPLPSRRGFLRRSAQLAGGLALGTTGYGVWEASRITVRRAAIPLPNLPAAFAGKTIAVLADLHHGPNVGIGFIRQAVRLANSLRPDAFALVGDFADRGRHAAEQLPPCLGALSALNAPLGVFAVPGNHDLHKGGRAYDDVIASTPITDLTNRSVSLTAGGESLWVAGVDDLWSGRPDMQRALAGIPARAAVVLLCHNPDYAEQTPDARVGLMLSGHTHGGQVYLPVVGSPWLPSRYGLKYRRGLVQGPASRVFVSRGLGESGVPLRLNSPPEINLLTLIPEAQVR